MQIVITQEVTTDQIKNLLDEASRGAAYWCKGIEKLAYESVCDEIIAGTAMLTLRDVEEDKQHFFDLQNIKAGLKIMAEKYPKHFGDAAQIGGDYNSDANTGDVFLQCALFGEIVYG